MKRLVGNTAYAVINFLEASVALLTLGYYTPTWTLDYLCWKGKKKAMKKKMENLK